MNQALPREMQQHTYAIMDRVEEKHWWFVGRRAILESFLRQIIGRLKGTGQPGTLQPGPARNRLPTGFRYQTVRGDGHCTVGAGREDWAGG